MAVNAMAVPISKNKAKTGNNKVPKPNPEKKVSKDASNEIIAMDTYIIIKTDGIQPSHQLGI